MNEGRVHQTTPSTRACAVRQFELRAETKTKKGVSDKNSRPVQCRTFPPTKGCDQNCLLSLWKWFASYQNSITPPTNLIPGYQANLERSLAEPDSHRKSGRESGDTYWVGANRSRNFWDRYLTIIGLIQLLVWRSGFNVTSWLPCQLHTCSHLLNYPARACAKGLSNWFCPSLSLSVQWKFFECKQG